MSGNDRACESQLRGLLPLSDRLIDERVIGPFAVVRHIDARALLLGANSPAEGVLEDQRDQRGQDSTKCGGNDGDEYLNREQLGAVQTITGEQSAVGSEQAWGDGSP